MNYILFSSEEMLNISIYTMKQWNGIIEYSYDNVEWKEWDGSRIFNNKIYMRGINNTVISGGRRWQLQGTNIRCQGNIENLLDYKLVEQNVHPKMESFCFSRMFDMCVDLIEAPQLSAIELSPNCYHKMFLGCYFLTTPPEISAIKLAPHCCEGMFENCHRLKKMPNLPAVSLEIACYRFMFLSCPSLTETTELSALELPTDCYYGMFSRCKTLTKTPQFPNMIIAKQAINHNMFVQSDALKYIDINNKQYDINILKLL